MSTAVGEYMDAVPAMPNANSTWGSLYAWELRDLIVRAAERAPRNRQVHLGPSELGAVCDRNVIGKMAGQPRTGHVIDPWPSIIGTAVHAWLAEAFARENLLNGVTRWVPEARVVPLPGHSGTADLYDAANYAVVDWKVLGETTMRKIKSPDGPPRHYVVQLLLYAMGYRNMGLRVDRVVLAALPRTAPSLSQMYVWDRPHSYDDDLLISQVIAETQLRAAVARRVMAGEVRIEDVPRTPSDQCGFCPFFRPESARDGLQGREGCPGHSPMRPDVNAFAVLLSLRAVCKTLDSRVDFSPLPSTHLHKPEGASRTAQDPSHQAPGKGTR